MNKVYFTTGPTETLPELQELYADAVKNKIFSISHRSEEFSAIVKFTVDKLRELLGIPGDFQVLFLASATECMERSIQNLVEKKSFHFINGYFAQRYYDIAVMLGKTPEFVKTDYGKGFNFNETEVPEDCEMICITHNETSTGTALKLNDIYELKSKYPDKILALDMVTSLPYYKPDFRYADLVFFSVQKGFGLPPGLGVSLVKNTLIDKVNYIKNKGISIGSFNNYLNLFRNADKYQTTVTPNIPGIYLLGKACELLIVKGTENIKIETAKKADLLYNFFDKHSAIKPFVTDKDLRSKTTIVLETGLDIGKILEKLDYNGFVLSRGYKDFRDRQIRIGNFPVHRFDDVMNLIYLFRKF
ncbi:MAG: aminotransferase class V-fold PLP-dependent enzyme [Ignavibacteria bacterium]|nr:aminotransferase class V-fold PLP-dependent enzyme [Ignavibacteria bacterium]